MDSLGKIFGQEQHNHEICGNRFLMVYIPEDRWMKIALEHGAEEPLLGPPLTLKSNPMLAILELVRLDNKPPIPIELE